MKTSVDYALFAGAAYHDSRADINRFSLPNNWSVYSRYPADESSGFEASAFKNGNEIVISFAGTDFSTPGSDFLHGNIPLAIGIVSDQLKQAAKYYLDVKALNPNAHISLTGHSLGGGLAALIGVFFGEEAFTFDQAPFYATALNGASTLKYYLLAEGCSETELVLLTEYIRLQGVNGGGILNEHLVHNINVQGEIVSAGDFLRVGIETQETIFHGTPFNALDVGFATDLHSQALLIAFLQSEQTTPLESLSDVTFKLTDLLPMFFDEKLFAYPVDPNNTKNENFLERLVRHELLPDDAMLTRFTADLWKLAQDGGLTMNDGNFNDAAANELSKSLIAFAMQKYYEETASSAGYQKELFEQISGGIQFDMADVSANFSAAFENNSKLNLTDPDAGAKGFALYFKSFLAQSSFTGSELTLIQSLLPYLRDWYVQAGSSYLSATDSLDRGAFMLGGNLSDALTGGNGSDLLVGNIGNDTLTGGKGNDILLGGLGYDTYIFQSGDGLDTVFDREGHGGLVYDGVSLSGGAQYGDARVYKSADKQHLYTRINENTLVIDGQIIVQEFAETDLGITFSNAPAESDPATTNPIFGDLGRSSTKTDVLGNGELEGGSEPGRIDFLYDSEGNDWIVTGGGGDSVIALAGGDDIIESGEGRDRVFGGAGNDVIIGGADGDILCGEADDDRIYADEKMTVAAAIAAGNSGSGSGQQGDWLAGGAGDDTLVGSTGNDVLTGGCGRDLLIGGAGDDVITGDSDWVATSLDWTVNGQSGNWLLQPIIGTDLPKDGGADVIYAGQGNDIAHGGIGNDVIFGERGDDFLSGNSGNDVISGGEGNDQLSGDSPSVVGEDVVEGSDILFGDQGEDTLYGNGGDDFLIGGTGNDTLIGGAGRDTYIFNKGDGRDVVVDSKTEGNILRFGAGFDQADVTLRLGSLMLDLGDGDAIHIENFDRNDVFNSSAIDSFEFADGTVLSVGELLARGFDLDGTDGDDLLYGTNTVDRILGMAGNDQLQGAEGDDLLMGGSGADSLWGGAGNDVLNGGEGCDYLAGGSGDDTYVINLGDGGLSAEGYTEAILDSEGINSLEFGAGIRIDDVRLTQYPGMLHVIYSGEDALLILDGLSSAVKQVRFADGSQLALEALYARNSRDAFNQSTTEANAHLVGSATNNVLTATGGDSIFRGGRGDDVLTGSGGGNIYLYELGDGIDHIYDTAQATSPNGTSSPNRVQFGSGILPQDVRLSLGAGGTLEVLVAGDPPGKLIIHSFDANDALNSSAIGYFDFSNGTSLSYAELLGAGFQLEGEGGNDNLLGSNLDDLLIGNAGNDTLTAGAGDDILQGGVGDDLLLGGAGTDLYLYAKGDGSDTILETADGSINTLRFASGLAAEDIELAADPAQNLILRIKGTDDSIVLANWLAPGSDLIQRIEFADGTVWTPDWVNQSLHVRIGSSGNDVLTAFAGQPSTLYGLAGNDTLIGGGGDDQLVGGAGDDHLAGALGNDSYLFSPGDGQDTLVESGGSDAVVYGVGIAASDVTATRVSSDLLLSHNNSSDTLTIQGWFSYTDGRSWVEEVRFADGVIWTAEALTARVLTQTGTDGDDHLTGIDGFADTLDGAAGNDTLQGGTGNDSYYVDSAKDVVIEYADGGLDTVYSAIKYTLGSELENLTLIGSAAINGSGNVLDNCLTGNLAANSLSAGAGNDTLDGAAGDDNLNGGLGNDTYLFGRGYGSDLIVDKDASAGNTDVARFLEGIEVEQLWFREVGKGKNKDLEVSVIGTDDKLIIDKWYAGSQFHIEQFKTADGKTLMDSRVQNLVDAMAAFAPPAAGQTHLPTDYHLALDSVIAANWQ